MQWHWIIPPTLNVRNRRITSSYWTKTRENTAELTWAPTALQLTFGRLAAAAYSTHSLPVSQPHSSPAAFPSRHPASLMSPAS